MLRVSTTMESHGFGLNHTFLILPPGCAHNKMLRVSTTMESHGFGLNHTFLILPPGCAHNIFTGRWRGRSKTSLSVVVVWLWANRRVCVRVAHRAAYNEFTDAFATLCWQNLPRKYFHKKKLKKGQHVFFYDKKTFKTDKNPGFDNVCGCGSRYALPVARCILFLRYLFCFCCYFFRFVLLFFQHVQNIAEQSHAKKGLTRWLWSGQTRKRNPCTSCRSWDLRLIQAML